MANLTDEEMAAIQNGPIGKLAYQNVDVSPWPEMDAFLRGLIGRERSTGNDRD